MKTMPAEVHHYSSSPDFTETTVPAALLRNHVTAAKVWARIVILEGSLRYTIIEEAGGGNVLTEHLLTPAHSGVIEPKVHHHVEVLGPVRFRVDFYR
jgi:tellurite resistance-related uncharacterized protein